MAEEEITEAIKKKRWYLTSKTIWVWILFTIATADAALMTILYFKEAEANKEYKKSADADRKAIWAFANGLSNENSELSGTVTNMSNTMELNLESGDKVVETRLTFLERCCNIAAPRPVSTFTNARPPSMNR